MAKNKEPRYRLKPAIALKLGLTLNKQNRYYLNKERERKWLDMSQCKPLKRLFFDIETSRMVLQVKAFSIRYEQRLSYKDIVEDSKIICISYKWEGEDQVHHVKWDKNHCDKQLLKKFIPIMNEADELVGHNGDNFDIKIVRTRAIYHRLPFRVNTPSLDTLKKARSYFKFPNNKLDTIAHFLGVGAKIEHEGIRMWNKVELGDKEALKDMIEYCDMDVVVLEDCYTVMENYVKHNQHAGVADGGYKHECPLCGSEDVKHLRNRVTAAGTIKRLMQCGSCDYDYEISNSAYRTMLELVSNIIPRI